MRTNLDEGNTVTQPSAAQAADTRRSVRQYEPMPIPEADLRTEYDKIKSQIGDKEYKVRHILVEKEDEAKAIITELNKGGDFAKIAKEKSKDPGSKDNGGDLDWGPSARYVKPFADAVQSQPKGKISTAPVKSDFGYHVIRVTDIKPEKVKSLAEATPGESTEVLVRLCTDLLARIDLLQETFLLAIPSSHRLAADFPAVRHPDGGLFRLQRYGRRCLIRRMSLHRQRTGQRDSRGKSEEWPGSESIHHAFLQRGGIFCSG